MINIKVCRKCNQEKHLEEFHRNSESRDKKDSRCKLCVNKQSQKWYLQNKDRSKQLHRDYLLKNPNYQKESNLRRKYGITLEEYERLWNKQNGKCAICGTDKPGGQWNSFHVDHNHETSEVRGLLCNDCNLGLGKFKDNPMLLRGAIDYLTPMQPAH